MTTQFQTPGEAFGYSYRIGTNVVLAGGEAATVITTNGTGLTVCTKADRRIVTVTRSSIREAA